MKYPRLGKQEELLKGNIDIGILHPPLQHTALHIETAQSDPCVLALPKQHPLTSKESITIEDLRDEPIITVAKEAWYLLYTWILFSSVNKRASDPTLSRKPQNIKW
nr:LysR substrate-binding domain-containing protein [Bacillus subtilis]